MPSRSTSDITELKRLISQYEAVQTSILDSMNAWGSKVKNNKETFTSSIRDDHGNPIKIEYTLEELVSVNFDSAIGAYKADLARAMVSHYNFDRSSIPGLRANIELLQKAKVRQVVLVQQYPELKDFQKKSDDIIHQIGERYDLAGKIAVEENKLYQNLYQDINKQDNGPNACKNFVL